MNILSTITEEFEEELPEECSDLVNKLKNDLLEAQALVNIYETQLERYESNEMKIKELMALCQSKNSEIFALERKVKDLTVKNEEKDKQIISMLSMVKDFKFLVESNDKSVQTENHEEQELKQKIFLTEEKNEKIKDLIASQYEEIQRFKTDASRELLSRRKVELKGKAGGYVPLFMRKPKDGIL